MNDYHNNLKSKSPPSEGEFLSKSPISNKLPLRYPARFIQKQQPID